MPDPLVDLVIDTLLDHKKSKLISSSKDKDDNKDEDKKGSQMHSPPKSSIQKAKAKPIKEIEKRFSLD